MTIPIHEQPLLRQRLRRINSRTLRRLTVVLLLIGIVGMMVGEVAESDQLWKLGIWTFLSAFVTAGLYKVATYVEALAEAGRETTGCSAP